MLVVTALLALSLPQSAAADQNDPPGRVARLKYVQGAVSFEPAGEPDWVSAVVNRPMTTGDKLWADPTVELFVAKTLPEVRRWKIISKENLHKVITFN